MHRSQKVMRMRCIFYITENFVEMHCYTKCFMALMKSLTEKFYMYLQVNRGDRLTHINHIVLLGMVCVAALTDLKSSRISNKQILTGLWIGLILKIMSGGISGLAMCFLSLTVTGIITYLLWRIGTFGAGDAKLLTVIGGMTDIQTGMYILICSLFVAAIASVYILVRYRHQRRHLICFAPMIAVATFIVLILRKIY